MISLKNVSKYFGEFRALNDVSLEIALGERVVVCGPSGSGKSTMIRCINRLEEHDDGEIWVNGNQLNEDVKKLRDLISKCEELEEKKQTEYCYKPYRNLTNY